MNRGLDLDSNFQASFECWFGEITGSTQKSV